MKNQDVSLTRVKDELKSMEEKLEESVAIKVREKEKLLARVFADKDRELQGTMMPIS